MPSFGIAAESIASHSHVGIAALEPMVVKHFSCFGTSTKPYFTKTIHRLWLLLGKPLSTRVHLDFPRETMAAAAMVVDPACVAAIDALLGSKKPVNQMVDKLVETLHKYGLAHYQSGVTPAQVLCHPHNRAKQMISWLDMWAKGQQMLAIGMKRQLLGESMAIELSIDPTQRDEQINANRAIIEEAAGSMAPLCGQERV